MDAFEYSESDVLYTQLSLFQKFMKHRCTRGTNEIK